MAVWAKPKIYFKTLVGQTGGTLTASTTASGDYSVDYLNNRLEVNKWKASNASDTYHWVTVDTGEQGEKTTADYVAIAGHNLGSASAYVVLGYSNDGINFNDCFPITPVRSDKVFLKEFANPGSHRYWRLVITGQNDTAINIAPEITILSFGLKAELDFATASFDPDEQEVAASVNKSYGGHIAGIHVQYVERFMRLEFADTSLDNGTAYLADGTYAAGGSVTAKGAEVITTWNHLNHWWEKTGLNNFFVAWEINNSPDEVYLMRHEGRFMNPLQLGGSFRNLALNLAGRKE